MDTPSAEELDRLAEAARSGTMEDNNALWSAVFALPHWWFLSDEQGAGPRVGVVDDKPFVLAFTSSERARRQATSWGLPSGSPDSDWSDSDSPDSGAPGTAEQPEAADPDVMALPPDDAVQMLDGFGSDRVFGIVFDQGLCGFFAPLQNLRPIREHVRALARPEQPGARWFARYRGGEYPAELLGDGSMVELLGGAPPEFAVDEDGGGTYAIVPRPVLDDLFALNLTGAVGGVPCGAAGLGATDVRLVAAAADAAVVPGWTVTDVGVAERRVERAAAPLTPVRTPLSPRPQGPPVIVQKVLTAQQFQEAQERRLHTVSGFVSVLADVVTFRTPTDIVRGLALDFPGSPFDPDAESIAVLRFALRDGTWRLRNQGVAGGVPVFFLGPGELMPVPVDAEVQQFDRVGEQRLLLRYRGTRRGWLPPD